MSTWRDFELVLHVDTDLAPIQPMLERAAASVRRLTHDRARLTLVFDIDFNSIENLKAHRAARHSQLIGVLSTFDIVATLDASTRGGGQLMAATVTLNDGTFVVFLILDRINDERLENTVTHELGHVIGFPDLAERGAIMSGASISGSPAIADWTPADIELCRTFRYCD